MGPSVLRCYDDYYVNDDGTWCLCLTGFAANDIDHYVSFTLLLYYFVNVVGDYFEDFLTSTAELNVKKIP